MESQTSQSSHAPGMRLSTPHGSPQLRQLGMDESSRVADQRPLSLQAIARKALITADIVAANQVEKSLARTSAHAKRSGPHQASSIFPNGHAASALAKKSKERRFRRPRVTKSRILREMHIERLMLGDEETIRRDEAEGERHYFSRHVGIKFHNDLRGEGGESAASSCSVSSADHCKFGRVDGPKNRPSHYHRDWVSKKGLCDRGQMGKGMYSGHYVHTHDQIYFKNEAGNKMWLVDDEGQAIFFQRQTL